MFEYTNVTLRFAIFALMHSICATSWIKSKIPFSQHCYRRWYNVLSLIMFGWVMASGNHSRVVYVVPGVWSLILHLIEFGILIILVGCLRQTGLKEFIGIERSSPHTLTTSGWYGIVRHPLYLFSMLFLIANPVMTVRWALLTILSGIYFLVGGMIEERRLEEEFGSEYSRYREAVPFILPSLRSVRYRTASDQN